VIVVGGGLPADQDHRLAPLGPRLRVVGGEHGPAHRRPRAGVQAGRDRLAAPLGEDLLEQLLEPVGVQPQHGGVDVDQPLVGHVVGHHPLGERGPLADPGLQQPELALLDGELDVAHVPVALLQGAHVTLELLPRLGMDLAHVLELEGVADAGDHVLALRVGQVVAVRLGLAVGRVAGERHPGAGVLALVAEHHRLDVHGGAEGVVDLVLAPVVPGPLVVPGAEHGLDAEPELLLRVLGELPVGVLGDDPLERVHQPAQVTLVQVHVVEDALGLLGVLDGILEAVAVHAHDGLAEHLQQPPVGVPGEPLRPGLLGQPVHALVVQADVQHRVHHARHRERRPRADADQQWVARVAEPAPHLLLQRAQVPGDLVEHPVGELPARGPVGVACLAGDGEPVGHGQPHVGHLGEVGPLPAEQLLHVPVALFEVVHVLVGHGASCGRLPVA